MTARAPAAAEVSAAYRHCEQVTRTQARNFSYGIRLLPGDKRRALSAVYALARRVDDIGDGTLPATDKLAALADARSQVAAVGERGAAAAGGDPVLVALADAAGRFAIPLGAFGDLIDGCEADVRGVSRAAPLADDLGVALQLTNILRDIREDLSNGRVYLPAEDQERFGCALSADRPEELCDNAGLERLVLFEAQRARDWYATGMRLMPLLDRRSAASAGAMAGIYFRLLEHISAAPATALRRRLSLSTAEKAAVAARALAGMARRPARPPAIGTTSAGPGTSAPASGGRA